MKHGLGMLGLGALLVVPSLASSEPADGVRKDLRPEVIEVLRSDISPPLREMARQPVMPFERRVLEVRRVRPEPPAFADRDPVYQDLPSRLSSTPMATKSNVVIEGQGADGVAPPDTEGAAGLTQYVQWVNVLFNVYNKSTGALLAGPIAGNQFWSGFGGLCQSENDGDPIILYDKMADRWIAAQFAFTTFASTSYCVAVSTTPDALGPYFRVAFNFGDQFPDYPKIGVWPDAYYVTVNTFPNGGAFTGAKTCAMDRSRLLAGLVPTMQCFQLPSSESSLLPSDLDGVTLPPAGSPNYQLELGPSSFGTSTTLRLWKFHVDFAVPANTTLTGPISISVAAFSDAGTQVTQPAPGELLDSLGDRLMYRLPYRNFGDHESLVAAHSINSGGRVAVRWYEIRSPGGVPNVFQQTTTGSPSVHLWMPSIAMDKVGNMLFIFNASGPALQPGLFGAGRRASDPPGMLVFANVIQLGSGVQFGTRNRWGDYAATVLDPVDDCTFWATGEYIRNSGSFNWSTKIVSGKFPTCQ